MVCLGPYAIAEDLFHIDYGLNRLSADGLFGAKDSLKRLLLGMCGLNRLSADGLFGAASAIEQGDAQALKSQSPFG